mgnify:CR=1 FL=1
MSKGFGARQRAILSRLRPGETLELRDLAGSKSEYKSTIRAARGLADAGQVRIVNGARGLAVALPGGQVSKLDTSTGADGKERPRRHGNPGASGDWRAWVYGGVRRPR